MSCSIFRSIILSKDSSGAYFTPVILIVLYLIVCPSKQFFFVLFQYIKGNDSKEIYGTLINKSKYRMYISSIQQSNRNSIEFFLLT